ncbi:MAG: hypothetical protein PHG85_07145 [Candidatus Altiarchaeota archaeon]|nr:hypothetical protein [Candidatus Altiarchaeota archaeon]
MVRRSLRTRSRKKVSVRTPGGRRTVHIKKEKPGKPECGRCKKTLGGMPNLPPAEIRAVAASERIPSRPYAGILCNQCLDDLVRYVTRFEVKYSNPEFSKLELQRDLTLERFLPGGWHAETSSGRIRREQAKGAVEKKLEKKSAPKKVKVRATSKKKAAAK